MKRWTLFFFLFFPTAGILLLPAEQAAAQYCILRNPDLYQPVEGDPVCFEFYLAGTRRTDAGRMAGIGPFGECLVTDYAARQGWSADPFLGGPYPIDQQPRADLAMSQLSRYGGDAYGCLTAGRNDDLLGDRGFPDDRGLFDDPDRFDGYTPADTPAQPPWTTYRSGWGAITFHRDGSPIATYEGDNAYISGSLSGTVLEGYWFERGSAERCQAPRDGTHYWGRVRFVFAPDFSSFRGRWSYCNKPLPDSDNWNGSLN